MGSKVFAEESKVFNTKFSMQDHLQMHVGKVVGIKLISGKELAGVVKAVSANFVHLSKLSGKEFYEALIKIDHISAIEKRVRGR